MEFVDFHKVCPIINTFQLMYFCVVGHDWMIFFS